MKEITKKNELEILESKFVRPTFPTIRPTGNLLIHVNGEEIDTKQSKVALMNDTVTYLRPRNSSMNAVLVLNNAVINKTSGGHTFAGIFVHKNTANYGLDIILKGKNIIDLEDFSLDREQYSVCGIASDFCDINIKTESYKSATAYLNIKSGIAPLRTEDDKLGVSAGIYAFDADVNISGKAFISSSAGRGRYSYGIYVGRENAENSITISESATVTARATRVFTSIKHDDSNIKGTSFVRWFNTSHAFSEMPVLKGNFDVLFDKDEFVKLSELYKSSNVHISKNISIRTSIPK